MGRIVLKKTINRVSLQDYNYFMMQFHRVKTIHENQLI